MSIAVACENSGVVRDAFIAAGRDAISIDLLPTEKPGRHIVGDVRDVFSILDNCFETVIAFPDCTYLCSSGLHWNKKRPGRAEKTAEALAFVRWLMSLSAENIAIENPVGRIGTAIRPADQYVSPYHFGDDASKKTGLWLKGLPPLDLDRRLFVSPRWVCCDSPAVAWSWRGEGYPTPKPDDVCALCGSVPRPRWANQTDSGQNRLSPSDDRWKLRSDTYPGIAAALAQQWA